MQYIYAIKNLINNKVYVGSTKSPKRRKADHFYLLKKGKHHSKHLQNSYNKHGKDKFSFYILEECSMDERLSREVYHIQNLNAHDREFGYNIYEPDGDRFTSSQETKDKLSDVNPNKIKIDLYTVTGTFLNTFKSINDCSLTMNLHSTCLGNILQGKRKSFHGYVIVKHGDPFNYTPSSKTRDMSKFRK